jgi:hypothetical protein
MCSISFVLSCELKSFICIHVLVHVVIHVVSVVIIAVDAKFFQLRSAHNSLQNVQFAVIFIRFQAASWRASCIFSSAISNHTFFVNVFHIILRDSLDHDLHTFFISSFVIQLHFHNKTSFGLTNSNPLCTVADNMLYHRASP